jgi:hypothetical protein
MKVKGYKLTFPDTPGTDIMVEGELSPETVKMVYEEHGTFEPVEFDVDESSNKQS